LTRFLRQYLRKISKTEPTDWTVVSSDPGSTVVIENGTGIYGSKCVKISSSVFSDTAYTKQISGLTIGEKYRLTAYVKYQDVVRDPNSFYWPVIGPNVCIYPTWTYSGEWENLGTFYPGWKKIYVDGPGRFCEGRK